MSSDYIKIVRSGGIAGLSNDYIIKLHDLSQKNLDIWLSLISRLKIHIPMTNKLIQDTFQYDISFENFYIRLYEFDSILPDIRELVELSIHKHI